MRKIHELKCWHEFFIQVKNNVKQFEIRFNDREFKVGDWLMLMDWDPIKGEYSGDSTVVKVTYITDFPAGLKNGYVCLGISHVREGQ